MPDVSAARLESTWARHAVAHAEVLHANDPTWGTRWFPLADGQVVLQGVGMYVNRGLALGLHASTDRIDLTLLEHAAAEVGVPAAVEVGPATQAGVVDQLRASGYVSAGTTSVLTTVLATAAVGDSDPAIVVRVIAADELSLWQRVCIDGWGHDTPDRQRASNAYAAAAFGTAGERLLIAVDTSDARPVGCCSLALRDGLATLGGMSTLPARRGRGVQRALVAERLRLAREAGCDLAASSAVSGGPSERNLIRLGFVPQYVKATWARGLGD